MAMRTKITVLLIFICLSAYGQRYIADSIYLKSVGIYTGKWLSARTSFSGIQASDTVTRLKLMTRKATDSLYLVKKDTIARTKLMTRKATDSLYLQKTANRIKGTGAAGQVAWFATSDSIQGSNNIRIVTTSGQNNLVLYGNNDGRIPSVGANNNYGLTILCNLPNGTGAAVLANTSTTTTLMNGFTFGQYTGISTITYLARITGMSISTAPVAGSLVLSGRMIAGVGSGLGANANTYELDINGRGRVTGTFRVGGAINDTTNYNHEFDGRTSTLTIRPRVDNTTAIQFTNSAKTLKPLVINTNNGRAYRNSIATDSMYTVKKDNDLLYLKLSDTITRTKVLTRKAADSLYGGGAPRVAGSANIGTVAYNGKTPAAGKFYSGIDNLNSDSILNFSGNFSVYANNNVAIKGYSLNNAGIYGNGSTYGVIGNSPNISVYGSGGQIGVKGEGLGYGVYGNSGGGYGVFGQGTIYGIYGYTNTSNAIPINATNAYDTKKTAIATGGAISIYTTKDIINGSVSGSAIFTQPFTGTSYKKVIIYCNALNGTASWTFPQAFTYTPVILQTSGLPTSIVTTLTTTSVTVTGSNSTGFLIIEGF